MDLNLLISSDAKYLPHAVVTLTSACENNRQHKLAIHYLHAGLGEKDMELVRAQVGKYDATVNFILVDDALLKTFRTPTHLATPTYFRLLCGQFLPPEVDRILYLDCDVIVCEALDDLYMTDLGSNTIAAVRDGYLSDAAWREKLIALAGSEVREYFNAGVMLIDVARYRSAGTGPAALALAEKFHKEFEYADQDALNLVLDQKWKALPPKWNVQSHWYTVTYWSKSPSYSPEKRKQAMAAIRNPAIIHYTTKSKPWQFMNPHPLKREYWKYRNLTPYAAKKSVREDVEKKVEEHE